MISFLEVVSVMANAVKQLDDNSFSLLILKEIASSFLHAKTGIYDLMTQ